MSRIAGLLRDEAAAGGSAALLDAMLAAMPGEQRSRQYLGRCALGRTCFRRDAIGGALESAAEVLVALDGRILNADELRAAGIDAGAGDAALLATLYRKHGFKDALRRIVGDFAIALYDPRSDTLWIGRDRFGVKPLYWARTSEGFAFASQPRGLLAAGVPATPNCGFVARFAASHYRTFDNLPEESPYEAIRQVPARCALAFAGSAAPRLSAYWSLQDEPEWTDDEATLAERYRELLLSAVERRVRHAEAPAFTLSGGLDSSSVLCCAATVTGRKQAAVSSVYKDATYDERDEIQDVVAERVDGWHAVELGDEIELVDIVARQVAIHDEPAATATWLSHLVICDAVGVDGFATLFGGLGGDELNAGEYEYFPMMFADLRSAGENDRLEAEIAAWAKHHDHPIHRKDRTVAADMLARLTDSAVPGRCLPDRARMTRYYPMLNRDWFDIASFEPVMDAPFRSYLKNRSFQDMMRETLPCCLRAEDRQCTAAGLAHHDPFLDHELVEFMYRVPVGMKIRDGVTKQLLRCAMKGILPEATRTRIKKTGWNAPAHRWFGGRTLEALRDRLASSAFRERGIYDPQAVSALLDEHVEIVESGSARENHMMFFWQLINLELWLDTLEAGAVQARQTATQS